MREKFCGLLDVEKTFTIFATSALKVLPLLKVFIEKTFIKNPQKTTKLFSHVAFFGYGISQIPRKLCYNIYVYYTLERPN